MKYEINQLNNTDAVIISDEEIKKSDYVIFCDKNILYQVEYKSQENDYNNDADCKKVIATISPFKIEGLPMLELDNKNQEPCNFCGKTVREQMKGCNEITCYRQYLPNQEENVEKLAEHSSEVQEGTYTTQHKITYKHGFIDGYKAAQSKKYSEEDIKKAIAMAKMAITLDGLIDMDSWISNGYAGAEPAYTENDILQSL